jgi:hypothetical protein
MLNVLTPGRLTREPRDVATQNHVCVSAVRVDSPREHVENEASVNRVRGVLVFTSIVCAIDPSCVGEL